MKTVRSYLCGDWYGADSDFVTLHDPSTEEPIAQASSTGADFAAAADWARSVGGPALRELSFVERGTILKGLSKALREHRDELLDLSRRNNGTTVPDGSFDIDGATGTLAYYGSIAKGLGDSPYAIDGDGVQLAKTEQFWGQHLLMPRHGVAVQINAFNFPAWGFAEKAACSLLAGMPVITKPATATALVTERLVEILLATDLLPKGALQLICGSVGDLLDHLGPYDVLAFTGSANTARTIGMHSGVQRANPRYNVEADSLNAAVLSPGADDETIELFLREVKREMTQKAGQKCTAARRILVPQNQLAQVEERLAAALAKVVVGNPAEESVRMGPLATARQLEDGLAGLAQLQQEAQIVAGGTGSSTGIGTGRIDGVGSEAGKGYFMAPTVLRADDASNAKTVHQHEVFGPVATLLPYGGTATEAGRIVALGSGSLVTSVYSDDNAWLGDFLAASAGTSGRVYIGSAQSAPVAPGSGVALPQTLHGGPGRAGAGEELGGLRGVGRYLQRVAVQGAREQIEQLAGQADGGEA